MSRALPRPQVSRVVAGRRWWPLPSRSLVSVSETVVYLCFSGALALVVHRAGDSLQVAGLPAITLWIAVAFAGQSVVVALLTLQVDPGRRWRLHVIDLAAWAPPLLVVLSARMGVVPDITLWAGISLAGKAVAVVFVLWVAIRAGLPDGRAALALGVFALALYAAAISTTRLQVGPGRAVGLTGDEPVYMVATVSLLQDHDLWLDDEYTRLSYWSFYPGSLGLGHSVPARDGHIASFHDAGVSILSVVPYALGGLKLVLVAMALVTAAILALVYLTARVAGVAAQPALLAAALVGASMPVAVYSTQIYPEIPVALCVIAVVHQFWTAQRGSRAFPVLAGVALGCMPWLHVRSWPLILVLAATAMLVWRGWLARAAVLAPLLAGALGYVALNFWVYGRLQLSPAVGGSLIQAVRGLPVPAVAIGQAQPWMDNYDGLLLLAPVLVLALAALPTIFMKGWAGKGTVAAIAGYSVLIGLWDLVSSEGWSPPGRFMVPVMPLIAVALAFGLQAVWRRPWGVLIVLPLAAWGLVCSFYSFVNRIGDYNLDKLQGPVGTASALFGVPLSTSMPNFEHPGPGSFLKVAAVAAVVAGLSWVVLRADRLRGGNGRPLSSG